MSSQYSDTGTGYETDRSSRESRTTGGDSGGVLKHIVDEAFSVVSERKDEFVHEAARRARSRISDNKNRAAEDLGKMASALREACNKLRQQDQGTVADYTERAADKVERFSEYLQEKEPGELASEAQEYVRQRPAILIGGAFLAGFLVARFLRGPESGNDAIETHEKGPDYQASDAPASYGGESYSTH